MVKTSCVVGAILVSIFELLGSFDVSAYAVNTINEHQHCQHDAQILKSLDVKESRCADVADRVHVSAQFDLISLNCKTAAVAVFFLFLLTILVFIILYVIVT